MEQICKRCGCSTFHYNRSRMRMECDSCGTPAHDDLQDQKMMNYDRAYTQAINHLTAGNWDQTISLLQPLLGEHPTDRKLYVAILRAATKDYRDTGMDNALCIASARDAWDKLTRLNGLTVQMLRYSRLRHEKQRTELMARRNRIQGWIIIAVISLVLAGVLFAAEQVFLGLVSSGILVYFMKKVYESDFRLVIKRLRKGSPDYRSNPFE